MKDISSSRSPENAAIADFDRRRDILFLTVLGPVGLFSVVGYFLSASLVDHAVRTLFLLAPLVLGGVWLAFEQMHDLVWWNISPFCPTCRKAYPVSQRPRPGMICDCCDKPLYPLRTPQDYKVIVLITVLTVVALPVFIAWSSIVSRLA